MYARRWRYLGTIELRWNSKTLSWPRYLVRCYGGQSGSEFSARKRRRRMRGTGFRRLVSDCTSGTRQRRHHTGSGDEVRNSAARGRLEWRSADRKLVSVFYYFTANYKVYKYGKLPNLLYHPMQVFFAVTAFLHYCIWQSPVHKYNH